MIHLSLRYFNVTGKIIIMNVFSINSLIIGILILVVGLVGRVEGQGLLMA